MTGLRTLFLITSLLITAPFSVFAEDVRPSDPDCEVVETPQTPLAEVVPQCMAERQPTKEPAELIAQDLKVCSCLQERNALFPEALRSGTPPGFSESAIRTFAQSSANNLAMSSITAASTNENATSLVLGSGMAEVRQFLNNPQQERIIPEADPKISLDMENIDEIPDAYRDNQCVTYIEYSAQRELPYDNSFFTYLGSTTRFIAADWNMNSLRAAYDRTTSPEAKNAIVSRMIFLARNPMYSAVFQAGTVEGISPEVITARKTDLFNIIRTLAPRSSACQATLNQCWREAQSSGAYGRFSQEAENFLIRDDVTDIMSAQTAASYMQEVQRLTAAEGDSVIPRTAAGYRDYLQSAQQDIAFGCAGPSAQASCYERFANHCSQIRKISERAASAATGEDIVTELQAAQVVHGLINPQQNQSFDAFNDMICRQQFRNAAGEASNFFEYRNRVCPAGTTNPACSDRREILARYLREYNVDSNVGKVNIRAGFLEALKRPEFVEISRQQIETMNRIAESPRELRARFGGRMPVISATGQLIPPTGSTSRTPPLTPSVSGSTSGGGAGGSSEQSAAAAISPVTGEQRATRRPPPSSPTDRFAGSDDSVFDRQRPQGQQQVSSSPLLRGGNQNLLSAPTVPTFQPQPAARTQTEQQRRPASSEETDREAPRAAVVSQGAAQSSGGGSAVAPAQVAGPALTAQPSIELPRRRNRTRRSDDLRRALLAKYENVSEVRGSADQQELIARAAVPVDVPAETIADVLNDPNSLNDNQNVMATVISSSESVVKLCVDQCETSTPVVVYAAKSDGAVRFSFAPPESSVDRLPASLSDNEMNVRVPDRSVYDTVSLNPSALAGYESVVRSAMSLPGDIVRLNVYIQGQDPILVYVDKRGPQPIFTTEDQQIIRAFRP